MSDGAQIRMPRPQASGSAQDEAQFSIAENVWPAAAFSIVDEVLGRNLGSGIQARPKSRKPPDGAQTVGLGYRLDGSLLGPLESEFDAHGLPGSGAKARKSCPSLRRM